MAALGPAAEQPPALQVLQGAHAQIPLHQTRVHLLGRQRLHGEADPRQGARPGHVTARGLGLVEAGLGEVAGDLAAASPLQRPWSGRARLLALLGSAPPAVSLARHTREGRRHAVSHL